MLSDSVLLSMAGKQNSTHRAIAFVFALYRVLSGVANSADVCSLRPSISGMKSQSVHGRIHSVPQKNKELGCFYTSHFLRHIKKQKPGGFCFRPCLSDADLNA
jgi:hypothetical protein